ncbi:MAG: hypothetical protein ACI4NE_08040 [Succinivibrio sp.]
MSVSSLDNTSYNYQIIQSAVNYRRLDEQGMAYRDDRSKKSDVSSVDESNNSSNFKAVLSSEAQKENYTEYSRLQDRISGQSKGSKVYLNVQNQDKMDKLSNSVGISVYA